jgi:hypothetical protein
MKDISWSASERKIARKLFESSVRKEYDEVISTFKEKANKVEEPTDLWEIKKFLDETSERIKVKYDFRYSQLLFVFGLLYKEGRITKEELNELTEEKQNEIKRIAKSVDEIRTKGKT